MENNNLIGRMGNVLLWAFVAARPLHHPESNRVRADVETGTLPTDLLSQNNLLKMSTCNRYSNKWRFNKVALAPPPPRRHATSSLCTRASPPTPPGPPPQVSIFWQKNNSRARERQYHGYVVCPAGTDEVVKIKFVVPLKVSSNDLEFRKTSRKSTETHDGG